MPAVGSPAERHVNWQDAPDGGLSPNALYYHFRPRIAAASNVQELMRVADELVGIREKLERRGLVRKPTPGDEEVKDAVKSAITGPFESLWAIVTISTIWDIADKGLDEGEVEACKDAAFEVLKKILERHFGKFVMEAAAAIKERDVTSVLKAAKSAVEGVASSFSNREALLQDIRGALRGKPMIVDKQMESLLRRWLGDVTEKVAGFLGKLEKGWNTPLVVALRVFFTPTNIADSELYDAFKQLSEELQARLVVLAPPPPLKTDYGSLSNNRRGPSLSAAR